MSPTNKAQFMSLIIMGLVCRITLGFVPIIYIFIHQLVKIPIIMEPLLMPFGSHSCPKLRIEPVLPK